jgi:hypothetical protein
MTSMAVDGSIGLTELKEKMLTRLALNESILKHWTINEYLNKREKFNGKAYERHLNSVINLTLSSLENMGLISIKDGQKGGAYSIKVYFIAVILAAMYGVLDYGQKHQITLAVKMMDKQLDAISKELVTSAPHTSYVLKNIMGKIGTCDYYNPAMVAFEPEKKVTSQLLLSDNKGLKKNKDKITNAIAMFKPVQPKKASFDLTEVSKSLDCQVSNVITAIEADAMLSVKDILQDTEDMKIVDPNIWDKISTGFGLLANPTATAVDILDKVEFTGTQSMRRLKIQQQQVSVLTEKFNIVIRNIKQIVSSKAVVVTNLGLAKKVIYGVSIAGVKAVTGASVDSLALVVPMDIPSAMTTAQATAVVEAIKMISLPLTYAMMDMSQPSETPEIEEIKGGRKKKRTIKKRKVMKGGLAPEEYVVANNEGAINSFMSYNKKSSFMKDKLISTINTIKESGMEGGYWIILVLKDDEGMWVSLGYRDEGDRDFGVGPNAKYFPVGLRQRGGRKKKTRKGKKGKKNKTKKKDKKGKKKTKKKRR